MQIDPKTIPSPPSAVQREKDVAPVDMFSDIAARHKSLPRLTLQEAEKHTSLLKAHSEKAKEFFKLSFSHEPLH
jgi:hypothetical protein